MEMGSNINERMQSGTVSASMPADRSQANQGVGKVPKPIPAALRDTPARKLGTALSSRDQASHSRKVTVSSWILMSCQPHRVTSGRITFKIILHQFKSQVTKSGLSSRPLPRCYF